MRSLRHIVIQSRFRIASYIGIAGLLYCGLSQKNPWYQLLELSVLVVLVSIILTFLDRKTTLPGLKQYIIETVYRCGLLIAVALVVLNDYATLAKESNMLHTLGIVMYIAYIQSWLYAHSLQSPPTRLLTLGHYSHTLFVVLLVIGALGEIYRPGALVIITSVILIGSTIFNRYLLWLGGAAPYNNEQAISIWRKILNSKENDHTKYARLWNHTKNYILQYPDSIEPLKIGISVLPLSALLSCLEKFEIIQDPSILQSVLRNAIEKLEPRAQWLWHLYDNEQACKTIAAFTAMDSNEPIVEELWTMP